MACQMWGLAAGLDGPTRGTLAPVRTSVGEDKLSLDNRRAEATGEPITLGMVERRLAELAGREAATPRQHLCSA